MNHVIFARDYICKQAVNWQKVRATFVAKNISLFTCTELGKTRTPCFWLDTSC